MPPCGPGAARAGVHCRVRTRTGACAAFGAGGRRERRAAFYAELGVELPAGEGWVPVACFIDPDAHEHGDRSRSCSVNVDHGGFKCHGCGASGNAYQAAVHLGLEKRAALELLERYGLRE